MDATSGASPGKAKASHTQRNAGIASSAAGPVPDVSILIVAYNSADLIEQCIDSIPGACTRYSFEILLVDNGDGSTQTLVAEKYPTVRVLPSRGNIGFAAGNNHLANEARGPFLLLLNPDMVLFEHAVDALLDGARAHSSAAAWGGVSVDRDGQPNSGNAIPVPSLAEFASRALGRSLEDARAPRKLDADGEARVLMGGFVMFSREAWDAAGGLDERYFLYCEEVDLFYRLERMGHRFWRIADAKGFHEAFHGQAASPMRSLYSAAGRVEFMRAHWSAPKRLVGIALFWLGAFERFLAGRFLGPLAPGLKARVEANRLIALRPGLWMNGYDTKSGLLAQLQRGGGPGS